MASEQKDVINDNEKQGVKLVASENLEDNYAERALTMIRVLKDKVDEAYEAILRLNGG